MYPSNNMNSFPFHHIPTIWFVSRRENLETYHQELSTLKDKVAKLAGGQNVVAILEAAESLRQLNEQVRGMEETFELHLTPMIDEYDPYNKNNLRRIQELASSVCNNLETIAGQMSWGMKADLQIAQVRRNLHPLLRGLEDTLEWLEQGT